MQKALVKNWMSTSVVTVTKETRLTEARQIIGEQKIRALPVVEDDQLIGIVTRRGLLRLDPSFLENEFKILATEPDDVKVGDVMTKKPITVPPDFLMTKAARLMLENKITALPVMENNQLVAILTNSDMLRFIIAEFPGLKKPIQVKQYMTDDVVTIDPDTSLLEAHRLMGTKLIRSLPVVKNQALVGIVTRTDLMSSDPSRLASRNNQEASLRVLTQPVEKVMTKQVITITPELSLAEAARLMLENKFHCLPVMDQDNKLTGIITESDMFLLVVHKF